MIDHAEIDALAQRVLDNETDQWRRDYCATVLPFLMTTETVEGGELTAYCRRQGLVNPHHPNVWPAAVRALVMHGVLEKVGVSTGARSPYSHDHRGANLWRSLLYKGGASTVGAVPIHHKDSYIDGAAYFAIASELGDRHD